MGDLQHSYPRVIQVLHACQFLNHVSHKKATKTVLYCSVFAAFFINAGSVPLGRWIDWLRFLHAIYLQGSCNWAALSHMIDIIVCFPPWWTPSTNILMPWALGGMRVLLLIICKPGLSTLGRHSVRRGLRHSSRQPVVRHLPFLRKRCFVDPGRFMKGCYSG